MNSATTNPIGSNLGQRTRTNWSEMGERYMNSVPFDSLPILLVDDEEHFLFSASFTLNSAGINNVVQCQDSRDVMPTLSSRDFAVVLLDMLMPNISGEELLPMIASDFPELPVLVITAINEVERAVESMKSGAFDYLVKPVNDQRLVTTVKRALEISALRSENALLRQYLLSGKLDHPEAFSEIVAQNRTMQSIFQYIEAIAGTALPVLITGETGTGKELVAKVIHRLSGRAGALTPVNVAGVDDMLFSDTLFGHEKGAFTGADRPRRGIIEHTSNGTLFLDEIGDLRTESQVKLLRLLQDGMYYPLGADTPKLTDARIIVATNREVAPMLEAGHFRKDLYYRLQTHHIHLPPLRDRRDDIPLLIEHFLKKSAKTLGKKKPTPPDALLTLLDNYHFPGNIRELESMIFDSVSRHRGGVLSAASFRDKIGHEPAVENLAQTNVIRESELRLDAESERILFTDQLPTLKEAEQILIAEALNRSKGNQTIASQLLGLSRRALNNRLRRKETEF